jgi:hypothetical protein
MILHAVWDAASLTFMGSADKIACELMKTQQIANALATEQRRQRIFSLDFGKNA